MTVKAIYEDGVFKPKERVDLQDKTEVSLVIESIAAPGSEDDDPTGWKTARELIGCIDEDPISPKASEDHDRYIYRK